MFAPENERFAGGVGLGAGDPALGGCFEDFGFDAAEQEGFSCGALSHSIYLESVTI
ncbi:MAG: hypothetical protein GX625_21825 [Clostridiaceae bacterium]|nr:hypothetical protein [Clostridiaceae bacterium]